MQYFLSMTNGQHESIYDDLFRGDGNERVVFALCGIANSSARCKLTVHKMLSLSDTDYVHRSPDRVTWKTSAVQGLLDEANSKGLAVLKIHCHPEGGSFFSKIDNQSDKSFFPSVYSWVEHDVIHASAVITPDKKIICRMVDPMGNFQIMTQVSIVGPSLSFYEHWNEQNISFFSERNIQAFGEGTYRMLRNLRIAVAGCSGTGSQIIEQLIRLGVSELVLIDDDRVEDKNLNRITNVTALDAKNKAFKVDALKLNIDRLGLGTKITSVANNLFNTDTINELKTCDVIFGCLDSLSGRDLLNRLATYYTIPYFDLGVKLTSVNGSIESVSGGIHYLQPGKNSLLERGVYTDEELRSENLYNENSDAYKDELSRGYIKGVVVDKPAVIPINAAIASFAILDFLARIHDYRCFDNDEVDSTAISISGGILDYRECLETQNAFEKFVGRGDVVPLLDMPALS